MNMDLDAGDLNDLAASLRQAGSGISPLLVPTMREQGDEVTKLWKTNARRSSGSHGKPYVRSIGYDVKLGPGYLEIEAGPDASKPQGGMTGFELGSANQPPHMDGARALAVRAQPFVGAVNDAVSAALARFGL